MKITVGEISAAAPVLQKLSGQDLGIKPAYHIARIIKRLQPELQTAEESRIELVKKYGAPEENGQTTVLPDNLADFMKEIRVLASTEIEIDCTPLALEMLERALITPADLIALGPIMAEWLTAGSAPSTA